MIKTREIISDSKIAFITYKGSLPLGVVIEDKELTKFEKIHFEILWKPLQKGML